MKRLSANIFDLTRKAKEVSEATTLIDKEINFDNNKFKLARKLKNKILNQRKRRL